ncbi:MAG TPA: hypothetical protein VKG38_10790 [Solirubrobacteraceae bacterium]|nr:hypothetical protein [Solirubrobacteraceae bacterium]
MPTATMQAGTDPKPNDDVLTAIGTLPTSFTDSAAKTAAAWKQEATP